MMARFQSVVMMAALVGEAFGITTTAATPQHILFLMIDDLGFNDVSYRNTSDLSSPHIDKLANAGIKLERYYTHNLCSPSRTAFLSGRFASTIGMQGCVIINGQAVDLPQNISTVADRLSQNFATAAFGKVYIHVCVPSFISPLRQVHGVRSVFTVCMCRTCSGMLG